MPAEFLSCRSLQADWRRLGQEHALGATTTAVKIFQRLGMTDTGNIVAACRSTASATKALNWQHEVGWGVRHPPARAACLQASSCRLCSIGCPRHAGALKRKPACIALNSAWSLSQFEADEVACALLARLRVPPGQWTLALKAARATQLSDLEGWCRPWMAQIKREAAPKGKGRQEAAVARAAVAARLGWTSFAQGMAQLQAAFARKDVDFLRQQHSRWAAADRWQELAAEASSEEGGSGAPRGGSGSTQDLAAGKVRMSPASVAGPAACPDAAAVAMLQDLASTHPPISARLERHGDTVSAGCRASFPCPSAPQHRRWRWPAATVQPTQGGRWQRLPSRQFIGRRCWLPRRQPRR